MSSFQPMGKTITFTAATTAPTPVQCVSEGTNVSATYLVSNIGTGWVFMSVEPTTAQATANAVVPTSTPTRCIPLAPASQQTFTLPAGAYFSGICASDTNVVYITPGYGE